MFTYFTALARVTIVINKLLRKKRFRAVGEKDTFLQYSFPRNVITVRKVFLG